MNQTNPQWVFWFSQAFKGGAIHLEMRSDYRNEWLLYDKTLVCITHHISIFYGIFLRHGLFHLTIAWWYMTCVYMHRKHIYIYIHTLCTLQTEASVFEPRSVLLATISLSVLPAWPRPMSTRSNCNLNLIHRWWWGSWKSDELPISWNSFVLPIMLW